MPIIRSRPIRRHKNVLACVVIFALCSFYILSYPVLQENVLSSEFLSGGKKVNQQRLIVEYIPSNCGCKNNDTKLFHNFCYRLPLNTTIIGRPFSCKSVDNLFDLGLLENDASKFVNIESSAYSPNAFDGRFGFPPPAFATAASDSHYAETQVLISTIQQQMPMQKIIFYDLGLSAANADNVKRLCNVEYRQFPFASYPSYVGNLHEYRWKPLIIAEVLKEFGAVWYMDSSVVFHKGNLSHVYGLLECRRNRDSTAWKSPTYLIDLPKNDPKWIESGFHSDKYADAVNFCYKFAYMLQGFTGHGIFSATNPEVYKYIPTIESQLKQPWAKMYEAGFVFVVRTVEVVQDVLKWYVLCALEEKCMAPDGSGLGCGFGADRFSDYAGCHRFDQSIINLLLANRNNYDSLYWTSGIVDFFNIVRGGYQTKPAEECKPTKTEE